MRVKEVEGMRRLQLPSLKQGGVGSPPARCDGRCPVARHGVTGARRDGRAAARPLTLIVAIALAVLVGVSPAGAGIAPVGRSTPTAPAIWAADPPDGPALLSTGGDDVVYVPSRTPSPAPESIEPAGSHVDAASAPALVLGDSPVRDAGVDDASHDGSGVTFVHEQSDGVILVPLPIGDRNGLFGLLALVTFYAGRRLLKSPRSHR